VLCGTKLQIGCDFESAERQAQAQWLLHVYVITESHPAGQGRPEGFIQIKAPTFCLPAELVVASSFGEAHIRSCGTPAAGLKPVATNRQQLRREAWHDPHRSQPSAATGPRIDADPERGH